MFEARFQSFDDPQPAKTGPRVQALRGELTRRGLSGFIVPHADRYQNGLIQARPGWQSLFDRLDPTCALLWDQEALPWWTVEHILKEWLRVLKPGGRMVLEF